MKPTEMLDHLIDSHPGFGDEWVTPAEAHNRSVWALRYYIHRRLHREGKADHAFAS